MIEKLAVEHRRLERHHVGKAGGGNDGVEQAGVVVGDHVLLHRSAGAAAADRPPDRSVLFDEVLLDHHHRLGRDDVVGIGAEHVQRGAREREAFRDGIVTVLSVLEVAPPAVQPADRASLVIAPGHATAKRVDEPSVPRRARRPWRRKRGAGLVEECDRVDRTIDRSHLAADDVGHRLPLGGRGHRDVGGTRSIRIERLEWIGRATASAAEAVRVVGGSEVALRRSAAGADRCRTIEVLDLGGGGAVRIERRGEADRLRLTDKRCLMRAVEHGSGHGMVDDGELCGRLAAAQRRLDRIRSDVQPGHEADERLAGGGRLERGTLIFAVDHHAEILRGEGRGPVDLKQHITAADELRFR